MTPENLKTDFDKILREIIAPFFKDLGFKRKTQHFTRVTNDISQCFNIQKSHWNSYNDSLTFTFNLGFYNEFIRTLSWGKEIPTEFPKTTDCFIQSRLGVYSHKRDHWYELSKRIDMDNLNKQVKNDLEKYLKPLFENYTSLESLKLLIESNPEYIISPLSQIIFFMATGQIDKGRQLIKEQHKTALKPQVSTQTINYPDGRTEVITSKPYINKQYIENVERLGRHYKVEL
jgi:hypothetical protein